MARNQTIYKELVDGMLKAGHDYSYKQCRTKAKNLAQKYKEVVSDKLVITVIITMPCQVKEMITRLKNVPTL